MSEDADRPGKDNDPSPDADRPIAERAAPAPEPPPQPPVDRAIARLGGRLGGRPLSVYGILLAGAAVLLILLVIVWITAEDGGDGDGPTCLNILVDEAHDLIANGEVERLEVAWAQNRPEVDAVILNIQVVDGACRIFQPQGVEGQKGIWAIVGQAYVRNQISEERQINIDIEPREAIPPAFLWTPTVAPSATVEPTPTVPAPTALPASPTAVPPTATPPLPASPDASPDASPAADAPAPLATATATIP